MHVLVTGGAGMLGARLVEALLAAPALIDDRAVTRITALDLNACPVDDPRVESLTGDMTDPALLERAVGDDTAAVCHLAAVVSSQAEADFDLGLAVNLDATRALLAACRRLPAPPRFVFASSLAVFGPDLAQPVAEGIGPQPRSSYGTQKAMGELLVNDYGRRGFIDARICRLPTVVVRPGRPNRAASSFASSIIREPLAGENAVCPVEPDLALWLSSPRTVVANLVHALALDAGRLDAWRVYNLPGLTVTVAEMLHGLERQAGPEAVQRVRFEHDPDIAPLVNSWPGALVAERAAALGFAADTDFDAMIQTYIADYGAANGQ